MWNFDELGPPDDPDQPLLDYGTDNNNNNQFYRMKRVLIVVGIISFIIVIIALSVSMLLIYMRKPPPRKPLPIHELITSTKSITSTKFSTRITTVFSTTTTQSELSSKQCFIIFDLLNIK
jgi:hypothetical protein